MIIILYVMDKPYVIASAGTEKNVIEFKEE
jgi:hypothetical protein